LDEIRRQLLPRIAQTPIPEGDLGHWQAVIRPVKASRESCLECHTDHGKPEMGHLALRASKLRDTLGYLVYLYRQRS